MLLERQRGFSERTNGFVGKAQGVYQLYSQSHIKHTAIGFVGMALIGLLGVSRASGATILGQVREHDGGVRIEQAVVELDRLPADGVVEGSAVTDLFGFFRFDEVPAGRYRMTISHPEYATVAQTNSIAATDVLNVVVELKATQKKTVAVTDGADSAVVVALGRLAQRSALCHPCLTAGAAMPKAGPPSAESPRRTSA